MNVRFAALTDLDIGAKIEKFEDERFPGLASALTWEKNSDLNRKKEKKSSDLSHRLPSKQKKNVDKKI